MPSLKRRRTDSYASRSGTKRRAFVARIPKRLAPGAGSNRVIIPLTISTQFDLTADPAYGYNFDTVAMYRNGSSLTIPGAAEMATVFDLARIWKVEISILPAATGLDYSAQTVGSGATNIPYVYDAVDYNEGALPTREELEQNPTLHVNVFNKVIRRTIYPRLEGANGVIDVGTNVKNQFMKTGAVSTQKWNGWKFFMDMQSVVWTYGTGRITFKIFYECMQSK